MTSKNGCVSAEKFVTVWQRSDSAKVVGKALGLSPGSASCKACALRKRGVPLKKMSGFGQGRAPLDIKALAVLAKKCAPKS